MSPSLHKPKSQAAEQKQRPFAASAKVSPKKAGRKARPDLRELAKEFAKGRDAARKRELTPLQRRMMSGGS